MAKKKLTVLPVGTPKHHRAWLERYELETGYDPLWIDELDGTDRTFADVAHRNVSWYEAHTSDIHLCIGQDIPWDFDSEQADADPQPLAPEPSGTKAP